MVLVLLAHLAQALEQREQQQPLQDGQMGRPFPVLLCFAYWKLVFLTRNFPWLPPSGHKSA